jgi:hypothetical protein
MVGSKTTKGFDGNRTNVLYYAELGRAISIVRLKSPILAVKQGVFSLVRAVFYAAQYSKDRYLPILPTKREGVRAKNKRE